MQPEIVIRWWALGLRGLTALGLGVVAFAWPDRTFGVLVLLFGVLLILDGLLSLSSVLLHREARRRPRFYLTILEGLIGAAAGAAVFLLPDVSRIVILYVVAGWAIITGILEIAAAIRLRRLVKGEWLLATSGALSVAFGLLIAFQPGLGVVGLMWLLGGYASLFGILLILLALRLRGWTLRQEGRHPGSQRLADSEGPPASGEGAPG